jgi:hypothetical protein
MKAFWAISKLTFKSAIRSRIFQFLLGLLILCVIILPHTISGDGTAYGFIQVSLKYNLGVIAFILSLSSIWLGCFTMTRDIENYQLHMVVTKPVSKAKIWLGKFTGVLIINFLLLIISSVVVFFLIEWQFKRQTISEEAASVLKKELKELVKKDPENINTAKYKESVKRLREKSKIENEVLVGRRVYFPVRGDLNQLVREKFESILKNLPEPEKAKIQNASSEEKNKMLKELRKQIKASFGEVKPGPDNEKIWIYEGIPQKLNVPLYLRYRVYVGKVSSKDQRETRGLWALELPVIKQTAQKASETKDKDKKPEPVRMMVPRTPYPEGIMCGIFNEFRLPSGSVSPKGEVKLGFTNFDPGMKTLHFQTSDGPKLLVKVTGFFENYCRAVFIIMIRLFILTGLACAAGAVLSMPTAVFMVVSYILLGSFASFLVGSSAAIDPQTAEFMDAFAFYLSKILLFLIIPMQNFEVSSFISSGELIEFSLIGKIFLNYFILKTMPIFLLGIWLYWRREMGLVIRK